MSTGTAAARLRDPRFSRDDQRTAPFSIEGRPDHCEQSLGAIIRKLTEGDGMYRWILLRETPLDEGLINHGDADLLGSIADYEAVLRFLLPKAVAGELHFRVTAFKPEKRQLTLFSSDMTQRAVFDLWIGLPQIDRGRRLLRANDVAHTTSPIAGAIERMPACLESAIYLHHLAAKRKPLDAAHTQERIAFFQRHRCADERCGAASWFADVAVTKNISDQALKAARLQIERLAGINFDDGCHKTQLRSRSRELTRPAAICVLGVDGVGKSTLIETLASSHEVADGMLTGKRLYRRSWLYQLLTRTRRKAKESFRERFDEAHCVSLFLRAAWALKVKLLSRKLLGRGTLLIDRSLADFLYRGRKSDHGRFHASAERLMRLAAKLPTVQLVAPQEITSARKAEITAAGHLAYDRAMLTMLTSQLPSDHLVFNNGQPLESSAATLAAYLTTELESIPAS